MIPPLITVLATGRSARPIVGRSVGPRNSAAAPTATPVIALPLNMSSIRAILVSVRWLPAALAALLNRVNTQDRTRPIGCHNFLTQSLRPLPPPSRDEQDLADMLARFHEAMCLSRFDEREPLEREH